MEYRAHVEKEGFAVVPDVLDPATVAELRDAFARSVPVTTATRERRGSVYGWRNVLAEVPDTVAIARSEQVKALVTPLLGEAVAVRAIFFDKTPEANWDVPYHQDLSIAVKERRVSLPNWGPYSEKAGVVHVQPPPAILKRLLTIRLHLDDCPEENGPLHVLPRTHYLGRLSTEDIGTLRREREPFVCSVPAGGAVVMCPLLLHASPTAQLPGHRRVLHIEYAPVSLELPGGLEWRETV